MKLWVLPIIFAITITPVAAEEIALPSLDLQSAIKIAMKQNPTISASKEQISIARAGLSQAKAIDGVKVTAQTGYAYVSKETLFGGMTVLDRNTNMNTIAAFKPIYTGGLSEAAARQARWGISAAGNQSQATTEEIIVAVTETFVRALQAKENLKVADDAVAALQANLDSAVKLKEAGTAPKSDVFRAETELEAAKESQVGAQTAYQTQVAVLRDLLNLDPNTQIDPSGSLPALPLDGETQRPELKAAQDAVKMAEADLDKSKAGNKPTIGIGADFLNIGQGAEFPRGSDTYSVGISASIPIFDGGMTRAKVDASRAGIRKAQADLQAVKKRIDLEKEQARLEMENADARGKTSDARLQAAQESMRALKLSYAEGIAPITDVLSARTALTSAETAKISSTYDKYIAQVHILRANGKLMTLVSESQQ